MLEDRKGAGKQGKALESPGAGWDLQNGNALLASDTSRS